MLGTHFTHFLPQGAFIDQANKRGETPLHVACADNTLFEVRTRRHHMHYEQWNSNARTDGMCVTLQVSAYLLSQGADTGAVTVMGDTPSRTLPSQPDPHTALALTPAVILHHTEVARRHKNHEVALMLSRTAGPLRPVPKSVGV